MIRPNVTNAAKAICRGFEFLLGGGGDKRKASSERLTVETLSIKKELLSLLNSNKPGKRIEFEIPELQRSPQAVILRLRLRNW